MSEIDLDAIEARQRTARDAMTEDWQDNNAVLDAVSGSMYDVPALVAEVRRLRARMDVVLELIDPDAEMAFIPYGPGKGRYFEEADIRRALDEEN